MAHVIIGIVFALLGAAFGGAMLDGGGALFGLVLGALFALQLRAGDRMRTLEAAVARLEARLRGLEAERASAPAPEPVTSATPAPTTTATPAHVPTIEQPGAGPDRVAAPDAPLAGEEHGAQAPEPAPDGPVAATSAPTAPGPVARTMAWLLNYATTGNVVAKAGVLVLFFGVSFLLKYAIDRSMLSIELRLIATSAAAIALIATGWRLRENRAAFGRILQGGGIGLLYLTVFAAARLYHVVPMGFAFLLLFALVVLSSALAVLQDARALAVLGIVGGFLAPVLTSTGSGSHVALFSYYALLNAGIVGIAWFKAWRILNLTGFAFTFVIGGVWGARFYRPEFFWSTEPFLVLSFLFYLAVSVLFALRHPPQLKGYVDGTLVFGLPLVVFGLQAPLVREIEFGRAWSAFGMGAIYLATAVFLRKRAIAHLAMLIEALLALAVVALSLAIPFAFDGHITAAAWALEGAGLVWIGLRQQRALARAFGLLLQFAAGSAFFLIQGSYTPDGIAVLNAQYLGSVFIAAGALFASYSLAMNQEQVRPWERATAPVLLGWGLLWWYGAGIHEIGLHFPAREPAASLAFLGASGAMLAWGARRLQWMQATQASLLHAPALLLLALVLHAGPGAEGPLAGWRVLGWVVVIAATWFVVRLGEESWSERVTRASHAVALWLTLFVVAWSVAWSLAQPSGAAPAWGLAAWGAVAALALVLLPRHGDSLDWPVAHHAEFYFADALLPVAGFALLWVLVAATQSGEAHPIAFVPLINPLDLVSAMLLLAVLAWWRQACEIDDFSVPERLRSSVVPLIAAVAFVWLNAATARAVHAIAGVPWSTHWLHRSAVFQGSLSVLWGTTALAVMIFATRRGERAAWMTGAALLGALVLKLFLVDLGDRGTVARIVSFLAAGGLMVLIGYLSPAPPRKTVEDSP